MPTFRPILPRPTHCFQPQRCWHARVPAHVRYNPQTTRPFSSAQHKQSRPSKRLTFFSTLIGGSIFVYYYYTFPYRNLQYLDAPPRTPSSPSNNPSAPIQITSPDSKDNEDLVPTGTSTIPFFPRTIRLPPSPDAPPPTSTTATRTLPYGTGPPSSSEDGEEYQLLGLGIRKVSFLRIQVYIVGLYIARSDLPKLQEGLVRAFFTSSASGDSTVSSATTLVDNEKSELRKLLLFEDVSFCDGVSRGEKIWNEVLRDSGVKSVLRIVTTRATDFGHMREGWVRSINNRSGPKTGVLAEKLRVGIDESVNDFKAIFGGGRKGVGKGKVLMMRRGAEGELGVWAEGEGVVKGEKGGMEGNMTYLGGLKDERISRLVWLGYLAGGNVASEDARKSVVEGLMEIVERPIGTIDTQVI
ncbi:MAG: hypothetical protein Q9166_005327 [cf. Caloplaca sp. 2 TL-2023]